ncbi:MAG TPA: GAF domain-containing protein, partial [Anaerolineales bacterium]
MVVLTREQIEGRLVALHKASLELVRDLSPEVVLPNIVNMARDLAGARYAALGVLDDNGRLAQFIPVGLTDLQVSRLAHPPVGEGMIGAIMEERSTIRIPMISRDPRACGFPAHHPIMKSFLGVPILLGESLLGVIYLTDKENYPEFTEDDEHVIETLAAYAAIAISNSRLYDELLVRDQAITQRNEDLAFLNEVASTLAGSLELDDVLDRTLDRVMTYLNVEAGEIFLRENGEQELRLAMHRGESAQAFWNKDTFEVGEGLIGIVAQTGKPQVSNDLSHDLRLLRKPVVDAGFKFMAGFPLTTRGNVVGVMNIASRQDRSLDKRELYLLGAIGNWAGITIENARLHSQARRLAVLEERERIGMDLHDGIVQSIYAVGLALDFARLAIADEPKQARAKIEQAIEGLNSTIGDIRSYISDLRPHQFNGEGLMEGLQRLVDEFRANTKAEATLTGPKDSLPSL